MLFVSGKVYNITPYLNYHPGGVDELMRAAGKDGTQLFDEVSKSSIAYIFKSISLFSFAFLFFLLFSSVCINNFFSLVIIILISCMQGFEACSNIHIKVHIISFILYHFTSLIIWHKHSIQNPIDRDILSLKRYFSISC